MKLEVFEKNNRTRVDIIRTYNYVTYTDENCGQGQFEIRIPTNNTSLEWLTNGNFILFENNIVGIIRGRRDIEDQDYEISIYGYLLNHILSFRSFLLTTNFYNDPITIARQAFDGLFINPTDVRRKIPFLSLEQNPPTMSGNVRYQNTGDTFLDAMTDMFLVYDLGFELYPIFANYGDGGSQYANLQTIEFRVLKPHDRAIGNTEGNVPVVFSFELNNLQRLELEDDNRQFASVAIVASEGVGEERKVIEVQNLVNGQEMTGYERIEEYVDARDIQTEDSEGQQQMTDEELEEAMTERGKEKLENRQRIISFDATILQGKYKYGVDFYKGDYVSIVDKTTNKYYKVQIWSVNKTFSNGVEHFDIQFNKDRLTMRDLKERRLYDI